MMWQFAHAPGSLDRYEYPLAYTNVKLPIPAAAPMSSASTNGKPRPIRQRVPPAIQPGKGIAQRHRAFRSDRVFAICDALRDARCRSCDARCRDAIPDAAMLHAHPQLSFCLESGSVRIRLPVAAKIALQRAGMTGGSAGSPRPVVGKSVFRKCTSTGGACGMRSNG